MEKSYGEQLRAAQLAGLCAAEQARQWRAECLADAPGPEEGWPWPVEEPAIPGAAAGGRQGGKARRRRPQKRRRKAKRDVLGDGRQGTHPAGWSDEDVVECHGCWYWRMLDATLGIWACWYPLIEDQLRPCRPADCYRHPDTPYRPCDASGRPLKERGAAPKAKEEGTAAAGPCRTEEDKEGCGEGCKKICREECKEKCREEDRQGCRE